MAHILLVGPGAIGGIVAAWLAQDSQHTVTVAARTPFDRLELETPWGAISARPRVITSLSQTTPVDWVLVATKAYDVAGAAAWLAGSLNDQTRVAVLQNGVEHVERFAPYVAVERIVPVMVDIPAERKSPGYIRQRAAGHMVVSSGAAGAAFVALFANTKLKVTTHDDFKSQVWKKLCYNCAGALSGIAMKPAVISRHDGVAEIMRGLVRECIAVARAEGATLDDAIADEVVAGYRRSPPDSVNSLHGDRIAGRQMEIDARNGVIVRIGRKHGIAAPLNQMAVWLLEAVQDTAPSGAAAASPSSPSRGGAPPATAPSADAQRGGNSA
jgi:2-dehydropantoate 2-reductase